MAGYRRKREYVMGKRSRDVSDPCNPYTKVIRLGCEKTKLPSQEIDYNCNERNSVCGNRNNKTFRRPMGIKIRPLKLITVPANGKYFSIFMRLNSFKSWSPNSSTSSTRLVDAGFFCLDASREICQCFSCDLIISTRELDGRQPYDVHKELSPTCEYIRRQPNPSSFSRLQQQSDVVNTTDEDIANRLHTSLNFSGDQQINRISNNGAAAIDSVCNNNGMGYSRIDTMHGPLHRSSQSWLNDDSLSVDNAPTRYQNEPPPVAYPARNPEQSSIQTRRESFMYWPHSGITDIDILVEAGFFFTGTDDIVRCFHCDIGLSEWNAEDDPWLEHARHSPDCPYLRQKKPRTFIEQVRQEWAKVYTPKRPELTQLTARLKTFENSSWPSDQVNQTPRQIAEAGFYYIGEGDTVRCHYCDGGLREWEPNDDPWVEHARWFPFCKYVLKVKGIQFIQNSATGHESAVNSPPQQTPPAAYSSEGQTMSYEDECRRKEKLNLLLTAAAQSVKDMGYRKKIIKYAVNRFISQTGRRDFNAIDLMNIICEKEDSGEPWSDNEDSNICFKTSLPDTTVSVDNGEQSSDEELEISPAALRKENQYLRRKMECIQCKKMERCMLFLPCGHRLACEPCSHSITECSHCGSRVDRSIKTYLA